jgi:hypothetical protein
MKVVRALVAAAASCLLFGSQALAWSLPSDSTVPYTSPAAPGGLGVSGFARLSASGAGTVVLVGAVGGQTVYVTQWHVQAAAGVTIHFVTGTGTGCATGLTQLTDDYTSDGSLMGVGIGLAPIFAGVQSRSLCAVVSGAAVGGVTYSRI